MPQHLVVDLETLGVRQDAIIASIAVVVIAPSPEGWVVGEHFYERVDLDQPQRTVSAISIEFWLKQNPEAQQELVGFNVDKPRHRSALKSVLERLTDWVTFSGPVFTIDGVWSRGPNFDDALLKNAYAQIGKPMPWDDRLARDCRTAEMLVGKAPKPTVEHNALADATAQAEQVIAFLYATGQPGIVR